jgi:hypothetical protein
MHEEDRSVEDNEVEAELQEKQEETSVAEMNWELQQHAGSSRDAHRFTGNTTTIFLSLLPGA